MDIQVHVCTYMYNSTYVGEAGGPSGVLGIGGRHSSVCTCLGREGNYQIADLSGTGADADIHHRTVLAVLREPHICRLCVLVFCWLVLLLRFLLLCLC